MFSARFLVALALIAAGIAWIIYYYVAVRIPLPTAKVPNPTSDGPKFMLDLKRWNYAVGFGMLFLGLIVSAHESTPLGRGRGVVIGMLGCMLIGLLWICTFYVISNKPDVLPIFNDLGQFNLAVGIAFMAVGFAFATKWT